MAETMCFTEQPTSKPGIQTHSLTVLILAERKAVRPQRICMHFSGGSDQKMSAACSLSTPTNGDEHGHLSEEVAGKRTKQRAFYFIFSPCYQRSSVCELMSGFLWWWTKAGMWGAEVGIVQGPPPFGPGLRELLCWSGGWARGLPTCLFHLPCHLWTPLPGRPVRRPCALSLSLAARACPSRVKGKNKEWGRAKCVGSEKNSGVSQARPRAPWRQAGQPS